MKLFAKCISYILSPAVILPLILILSLGNQSLTLENDLFTFLFLITFQIIIPLVVVYGSLRSGKIASWDIPVLKDRVKLLLLTAFCYLITLLYLLVIGEQELFKLNFLIVLISLLTALISKWWRISLHACAITFLALFVNYYLDLDAVWLYLVILPVCWSRYYLGKHSFFQLLAGILLTLGVGIVGFSLFGYF